MAISGTLESTIVTDVATDVTNSTIIVNATLAKAVRLLRNVAQRKNNIDEVDLYNEIKRIAATPNTARSSKIPHDWLKGPFSEQ